LKTSDVRLLVLCWVGLTLAASGRAAAQAPDASPPKAVESTPAAPAASAESKASARAHFDKGLAASTDQRFGEAVVEFERAFELWPDFRVLYNIGNVRVALGRFTEAVDAYQAYLDKGAAEIPEARQREVRDAIAAQQAHVATITVHAAVDGAEIRLDGRLVGLSPLPAPVRVNEGKHTLEALLPGRPTQLRELDLPGASALEVTLEDPGPPKLAAPPPAPAAPRLVDEPRSRPPTSHRRAIGVGVAAVGLVAAVVGGVLAYEGASDANAARARLVDAAMPASGAPADVMKYDAAKISYDDAKTRNQLGWALVGFGAAALVGGGALALVWTGSSASVGGSF
jgi:tetratricopeptide (TPR) repeat protein